MVALAKDWFRRANLIKEDLVIVTNEGEEVVNDLVVYLCGVSLNVPKEYGISDRVSMFDVMDLAHSVGELDGFVENTLVPLCLGETRDRFAALDLSGPPPRSVLSPTTLKKLESFGKDRSLTHALFKALNLYKLDDLQLDDLPLELAKTIEESRSTASPSAETVTTISRGDSKGDHKDNSASSVEVDLSAVFSFAQSFGVPTSETSTLSLERIIRAHIYVLQILLEDRVIRQKKLRAAKDEESAVKLLISWGEINERVLLFLLNYKNNKQMKGIPDRGAAGTSNVECTEEEEKFM